MGITHPGNIGATARAMKNMGLYHLRLVQPQDFPCAQATARASGADDLLVNAQIFSSYEESIQDCHLVFGTSARQRSIPWPVLSPRECAQKALTLSEKIAIVFGREHSGLTNQELDRCHFLVQIPTNPEFSSLNIAAAVQILTYELRIQSQTTSYEHLTSEPLVSSENMARFYEHLEQTLIDIEFLDPQKPKRLMRRLQRLFNRTQLLDSEINILRGILTATQMLRKNRE